MSTHTICVTVNDVTHRKTVESRLLLSDFLRDHLHLRGTHIGCEHGVCGVCTVLVDGRLSRSCLMFAVQADGASIKTVESLGTADRLHPIQQAFAEQQGLQCGFCTPAMLLTTYELLSRNPKPTREEAREAISGNLCRCTGYQSICDAVLVAARRLNEAGSEAGAHE